ncbi:MAG: cysteine-rich CWC family protein [Aureispira sp.]|nr:cysteine-rich CWC family protein [Aureispira sp.]
MQKTCSKCQRTFVCNATDIKNCHCSSVPLKEKTLKKLQTTYNDCLCQGCLKTLYSSEQSADKIS